MGQIPLPTILDNLIADKRIRPAVAVFFDHPPGRRTASRGSEGFADFLATELIPKIRGEMKLSADPKNTIIGGASAGGLCAAFVGLRHPEVVGGVIAQSGAF